MKKLLLSIFIVSSFAANAQFWTQKAAGFATASRGINCISIVDANVIWAKAYDGSATANPSIREYTKSTDGGNTWTAGTINPFGILGGVGSITAASATTAWITTYPVTATVQNHNAIWVTTNGGTTWTKQTTAAFAADSFANFVHFWDANNGVAMGDPQSGYFEIYTTSNGGTTWTRVLPANIPTPSPVGAEYGYTNNFYVAGNSIWFGTSSGRLFKSTDMGATWAASQAPIADFGGTDASEITGSYAFSDNNKGLLVKSDGTLYNTIDGGTTWNPVSYTNTVFVGEIAYVPGSTRVVSVSANADSFSGAGSSYSLNDGLSWTNAPSDTGTQFNVVKFLNENVGFAGGFSTSSTVGGIYKYTGTQLPVSQFEGGQFAVYPNPSNGIVNVSNTKGIRVNQISMTDLNGRMVKNIEVSDALENIEINVSDLSSGVYMMNINSDQGKTVKKIVKN